ncbi:MAG: molybdopterin cofactor-binding domain-containing protein, partial [Tepidisphaeraceae bacterium]
VVLSLSALESLRAVRIEKNTIIAGARASIADLEEATRDALPEYSRLLYLFGSPPIKHAGTLGGNIANGSPIGDSMPALFVLHAEVELSGSAGTRRINITDFYTGYKRTVATSDELLTQVLIPLPAPGDIFKLYKVSKRKDLDISAFTAALWMRRDGEIVREARIAFGGVGPNIIRMRKTEQFFLGKPLTPEVMSQAGVIAATEIAPISDVRGSAAFRSQLGRNVFHKLYAELTEPGRNGIAPPTQVRTVAAAPRVSGETGEQLGAVGRDIPHDSARGHVSGESVFIDDIPPSAAELLVDFVGSPVAHGRIKSIDVTSARAVAGVVAVLTARDISGHNHFGPIIKDEHLLVEEVAEFLGDPIVLIAAESRAALSAAKKAVRIEMEPLPPIFSIDDAIAANQFIGPKRTIARGNVKSALASADHVLEGTFEVGGQEHFYLESQAAIAYPSEHGQLTVHSSTQHPSEVQALVAEIAGVPFNHVTVITKRMGGGFGGKETQAAQPAAMAGLVASLTRRPARIVYNKDDDMRFTGKRHPFKCWYKVGFTKSGQITALSIDLYSNGGCSADLSPSVLERAMLHTDNAYFIPNIEINGRVCKTNLPSNTAFRGFGGPQGVANIENIIESISQFLGIDSFQIRKLNCYGIDDRN